MEEIGKYFDNLTDESKIPWSYQIQKPLKNKVPKNTKPWLGAVYSENILAMDCCIQKTFWKQIAVFRKHSGNG